MGRLDLSALFFHLLALWFVAVGGPSTILPGIHRKSLSPLWLLAAGALAGVLGLV